MEELERVSVEWLILADSAQVIGNKLYLLGGGWDVLTVNSGFPVAQLCAVAISFWVPWSYTNQRHSMEIDIETDDGQGLANVAGQFEVGRATGMQRGQAQRSQLAVSMSITLPQAGTYVVIARVNGEEERRVPFTVVPGPMLQQQKRQGTDPAR